VLRTIFLLIVTAESAALHFRADDGVLWIQVKKFPAALPACRDQGRPVTTP